MNTPSPQPTNRLDELLAESMVRALLPEENRELEGLAGTEAVSFIAHAERAAACASVAFAERDADMDPMPTGLQKKLLEQATAHFGKNGPGVARRNNVLPWVLTAAASVLAILGWLPRNSATEVMSSQEMLQNLVAQAPIDLLRLDWTVLEDPASRNASGEVLWSDREQRGYMRFRGLAANDAKQSQYQLWIFDDKTDTSYPVDGGVFDIPPGTGEVIVAIDPKIPVKEAFQFAITVENPGGVVVSKRERIPLLAAVPEANL